MSPNIRASIYMVLSMAGFTLNDSLVKSLGGALPITQVIAVRGLFLTVLIGLVLWQRRLLPRLREAFTPLVALRASFELLATVFFLTALVQIPFASISAILQALPLAVTLGAAIVFREPVGWRRWLAITVGFAGVLIIIRPGTANFESASLLVVVSVVFAAGRDLATRALPTAVPSLLVTAASAALVTTFGFSTSLLQGNWVSLQFYQVGLLALASIFLFVGYQFIVLGMRTGDVAYVAPYRYSSLLFAILLGLVFFDEIPDGYTLVGSAVVVSMGLFTLYRELAKNRRDKLTASLKRPTAPV